MLRWAAGAAYGVLAFMLAGCASFEVVGDPRIGALSPERLPILINSVRCELATFYTAELVHRRALSNFRKTLVKRHTKYISIKDLTDFNYFDLDTDAFSNISLDIKLQDTFGIPGTTTSINNVLSTATNNTRNLALGPSVQAQATYDDAAQFAIPQNSSVVTPHELTPEEAVTGRFPAIAPEFRGAKCFSHSVAGDYDGLAAGKYPSVELFERIHVDAGPPLAAWLQEASRTMGVSRNLMMDAHAKTEGRAAITTEPTYSGQAIDVGQLVYTFTVQYTGTLDAKFSLVTTRLNPLTADLNASVQQTGVLTLYINAYQALTALTAKSALVSINPIQPPPMQVVIVSGEPIANKSGETEKRVTSKGLDDVKEILTHKHKELVDAPLDEQKLNNLYSELGKNQASKGQTTATSRAIQQLNVPDAITGEVNKAIENNTVTIAPAPARSATPQYRSYNPTQSNDGRGYLRAPLGIPIQ